LTTPCFHVKINRLVVFARSPDFFTPGGDEAIANAPQARREGDRGSPRQYIFVNPGSPMVGRRLEARIACSARNTGRDACSTRMKELSLRGCPSRPLTSGKDDESNLVTSISEHQFEIQMISSLARQARRLSYQEEYNSRDACTTNAVSGI
jgi:hypothetical protein